jgi:glycosyltransferase involved in cell wall biosynthesis
MLIAVNVQSLVKNHLEGLGWFTYESFKRITQQHPEHQFLFIFGKGIDEEFIFSDNVKAINIGPPFFRPQAWYLKYEYFLPLALKKYKIDLFISSDGISSTKLKVKQLNVIHDLNFEENPQWLPKSFSNYYRKYYPKWANSASRIATVSEYSKHDIHKRYGIDLDKIDVVYNGSNDMYQAISPEEQNLTKETYTNGHEYFVSVGSIHPRKNIDHLLLGFDQFKITDKNNTKLVIVGSKFYWDGALKEAFDNMKYQEDVIFTGHLPTEQLKNIIASSLALTYISLFEGFGIPLVEAMNSETAILASNSTCLPEIAQKAAIYVDPNAIEDIANAMSRLSTDKDLRQSLIENGRIRKEDFSWDKTASKLWASIEKALEA